MGWMWTGSDEFSGLGDRKDEPPLALPHLRGSTRMVLVRHGQSTWNARNRIQGSSNFAVLTDLGKEQAAVAQQLVSGRPGGAGMGGVMRVARLHGLRFLLRAAGQHVA